MLHRIDTALLVPGRGEPVDDASVVMDEGTIVYAGARTELPEHLRIAPDATVPALMPGMWDVHCHLHGIRRFGVDHMLVTPVPTAAARAAKEAEAALAAGFTSLREAGGIGIWLVPAIEEGTINGPSIYSAGSVLSQTGGHADVHGFPLPWVADACEDGQFLELCDGVPEVIKAVRKQLRKNARVIKVCASGGIASVVDDPQHQQFSDEELRTIVEEAARADRVVMAHCHGKAGIMAALHAGAHTIEHGTYLDQEAATAMKEAGAILVPTRTIVDRILALNDAVDPHIYAKMKIAAERHSEAMSIAIETGVRLAAGTDIGTTGPDTMIPWGSNGGEAARLVTAGLSPLAAIEAITATGPDTLGPQAPQSGIIAPGFDADVIALDASPVDEITLLGDPARITHVWKSGRPAKQPAGR